MKQVSYPVGCNAVIDVTKPPYSADPTGQTDSTEALRAAINDVVGDYLKAFLKTKKELAAVEDDNGMISFEIRKVNGQLNIPFPKILPKTKILYFPKGTYLVSDTISYTIENLHNILYNIRWLEMNAVMHFMGEDREHTVIKLQDNCPGFCYGSRRAVVSFMQGEKSGVAMTNTFENLTVDIGRGNAGAVGLIYFGNNSGAVRNVTIRSSDPELKGYAGLEIIHEKVSSSYTKNVEIVGFDYGIRVTPQQHYTVFEHTTLKQQNIAGIYLENTVLSIKDLKSENSVPAVFAVGFTSQLILLDAVMNGGSPDHTAVISEYGFCFVRNITMSGYGKLLKTYFNNNVKENLFINGEYSSHGCFTLSDNCPKTSLNLPVEETPDDEWDSVLDWVGVDNFGAKGDGVTDDTDAISKAFQSGHKGIFFQPGCYLITKTITIPSGVNCINFMYCDLRVGSELALSEQTGVFRIDGKSETPLTIMDLFAWEQFHGVMSLIDHASTRTLVMKNLHAQAAALYFNSVEGGKVFIENCACTVGGVPGAGSRLTHLKHEDEFINARHVPCFWFKGQQVWARQINPERALCEIKNDGGTLWIMGFKTEEEGTAFSTINGGSTEVLGGTFCIGLRKEVPLIENIESNVSVIASTMVNSPNQTFPIAVKEIKNGETKYLRETDLPMRAMLSYTIPIYRG